MWSPASADAARRQSTSSGAADGASNSSDDMAETNTRSSEQSQQQQPSEAAAITATTTTSPPASPPVDADDGSSSIDRASLVVAPGLDEVVFESWEAFYAYLALYQARSYQHFRLRSTTSVDERNRRIQSSSSNARVMPSEWGVYAKTLVCTHAGKYRYRGTGKRQWHETRPMDCKAKINVCVQWRHSRFVAVVTKADLGHNHQLSKVAYSQYAPNRLAATHSVESSDELLRRTGAKRLRGKHLLQVRLDAAKRAAADAEVADNYERKEEPIIAHWVLDALYFAHERVVAARQARASVLAHASRSHEQTPPPPPTTLTFVDVGCSTGALSLAFAERYISSLTSAHNPSAHAGGVSADSSCDWRILATDMDARMLARVDEKLDARPRYQRFRSHVSTVQMDGQLLDKLADGSVDIVGSNFGLSIFPDRVQAWRSAARVLRDGGVLFATVWDAQSPNLRWVDGCAELARDAALAATAARERADRNESDSDESQFVSQFVMPSMRVGHASVVSELFAAGFRDVEMYCTRHSVMYESPRAFVDSTLNNPGFSGFIERTGRERLETFLYDTLAREGGFARVAGRATAPDALRVEDLKRVARPVVLDFVAHVVVASKQPRHEQ